MTRLARGLGLALLLLTVLASATARAAEVALTVGPALDEAERLYGELDYRGAAELAEQAAVDERASAVEQARGWERVGLSWLVLGQRSLAKEALDRLFTLEPLRAIVDPSLSPRQREFIEEVRAGHPPPPPARPIELAPVVALPAAPAPRPLWKRWYLWTPIVVGVIGVGLGLGLGLGLGGPTGTLPPGRVGLALHF